MLLDMPNRAPDEGESRAAPMASMLTFAGGGILTQLLFTISGVLAARMLGVEGRGQVVMVASLAGLASMLTLGGSLPNAITKQLAERGVHARDGLHGLVRRWVPWGLLAAGLAGGYMLFLEWDAPGAMKYGLAIAVVIMGLQGMASRILMGAMLGEGSKPIHIALTSLLPQTLVVVIYSIAMAVGIRWNAVELLAVTLSCVGLVLLARLRVLAKPTKRPQDRLERRELARLARRTHVASVGPIDGLSLDRMLVGSLLGNIQLGLYSVAFALGGLTAIFGRVLEMVALPRIARLQHDPKAETHFVRRWLLLSVALLGVIVVGMMIVLVPVIRLTFGPDFLGATDVARWMIVASGLLGFRRVLIGIQQGRGRGGFASVTELALTPLVVLGVVLAAAFNSLVAVGITMTTVAAVGCLVHGFGVFRSAQNPVATPPSEAVSNPDPAPMP
jgi:O-antigen/teichoic acid export membrane protein